MATTDSTHVLSEMKVCARGGCVLPRTREYFFADKRTRDGLYSSCKTCLRKSSKPLPRKGYKFCPRCGQEKPRTPEYFRFRPRANGSDYPQGPCRDCELAKWRSDEYRNRQRKWRTSERGKAFYKERKHDPAYKVKQAEHRAKPEQRQKQKENRERVKNRPDVVLLKRVHLAKRRARRRALPDTYTAEDWVRCLDYFRHQCAVCHRPVGLWHTLAMDHWIPISDDACPGTIPKNIVPLCHGSDGCNNSKSNKHPEAWLTNRAGPRRAKAVLAEINAYFSSLDDS